MKVWQHFSQHQCSPRCICVAFKALLHRLFHVLDPTALVFCSFLPNISTLAILISPRNSPPNHQNGVPKMNFPEFPGSGFSVEILHKPWVSRNFPATPIGFPEFPGHPDCSTLGSPFSAVWGEMELICWALLIFCWKALIYPVVAPRLSWTTPGFLVGLPDPAVEVAVSYFMSWMQLMILLLTLSDSLLHVVECYFMHQKVSFELWMCLIEVLLQLTDHLMGRKSLCLSKFELDVRAHILYHEVRLSGSRTWAPECSSMLLDLTLAHYSDQMLNEDMISVTMAEYLAALPFGRWPTYHQRRTWQHSRRAMGQLQRRSGTVSNCHSRHSEESQLWAGLHHPLSKISKAAVFYARTALITGNLPRNHWLRLDNNPCWGITSQPCWRKVKGHPYVHEHSARCLEKRQTTPLSSPGVRP